MKLSHLNALRALEASVRLGSFRAAAQEMGVSPAAVGQRVRTIEDAVGLELLERTANGFVTTPLAHQICTELETGFRHLARALEMASRSGAPASLSVSVVPTIAEYWLAPRLPQFWQANPGIELRLDSTSTILNPSQVHFDFALRYGPESPEEGRPFVLFPEYLLPVCTPELAARIDPGNRQNPFGDVALLHTASSTSDAAWADWPIWCQAMGFGPVDFNAGVTFTYTTLALRAMFAGQGVHLAQLSILLPALAEGRLVAPFGAGMAVRTGYSYKLVSFSSRSLRNVQENFVEWVFGEAQKTEAALSAFLDSEQPGKARERE